MWRVFENHEILFNLRYGTVVKLPVTNIIKYGINFLNFRDQCYGI